MAQHCSSIPRTLRTGFLQLFLLLGIIALPSLAFAVDSDGDGMPDTLVAANFTMFENFEAPLVGWTYSSSLQRVSATNRKHSGAYGGGAQFQGGSGAGFEKAVTVSEKGGAVTFWRSTPNQYLYVDGVKTTMSCTNTTGNSWGMCTASIPAGTHVLKFTVYVNCNRLCYYGDVDDISISYLAEDQDDDNDGVLDAADAFPLNAAESVDTDHDGIGNNADTDDDNDGVLDGGDNCPLTENPGQQDVDNNGKGDVCDLPLTQVKLAVGSSHTCTLTTADGVKCWGKNFSGQLGDNTTGYQLTPVDVIGLGSDIAAIAAGYDHTCALTIAGGVKCWGSNSSGQLGDNTAVNKLTPVDVIGLGSGVASISAGDFHTCALTTAGGMKCWGDNYYGQLGDNTTVNKYTPVDVVGLGGGVAALTAGNGHTCALTTAGGVKCWGSNSSGQLGDNTAVNKLTPVGVEGLSSGVTAIVVGGNHTCALRADGGLKCWGYNYYGQLGDGTTVDKYTPVGVVGLGSGVAAIAVGTGHVCALTTAGGVKCWGYNYSGTLGDNTTVNKYTAVDVVGLGSGVAAVEAGGSSCALTTTGGVKCWGNNNYGQVGDNTTVNKLTPVWVVGFGDPDGDGLLDAVDNCPANANADQLNTDGDTQGDECDLDDDNDGVVDTSDAFPLNAAESLDTDIDGIGNNADLDDDGDGVPDVFDATPLGQVMPLNANYKGSAITDSQSAQ